ncbi:hypothetical protein Calab_2898 [Caldithrix abyssi DSM 13497]|uniref:Por secretion system C-terminal sorting domain-containing protein n=1 Tax=Caldithrix abyssi DSM 13497 TaxID=880073 RepID=H1XS12_CALAY|nr:FG-GAP-like repeat-containing protein [Caldithrix abyssi]APF18505.1 Por secretion system C-terminal sorting domain-containing protein [Caldithrix abyssi DSM 13497]EHO42505.1 hypothetical protein Calab_2898 [Caldithrix abyssi DSM 13497]
MGAIKFHTLIIILVLFFTSVWAQYPNDPFQFPQELGTFITHASAWGDYDNDGDDDLYFSNGEEGFQWKNHLYRNNGDGTFTEDTLAGPIVTDEFTSGGVSWGDFDNDGDLDMLVSEPFTHGSFPTNYSKVSLYLNNGDGTFSVASAPTLTDEESSRSKVGGFWGDWNGDGFLDAFVSNANFIGTGTNHSLYTNNQNSTFTEESNNLSNGTSARAGGSWADFDGDGDLDLVTISGAIGQKTVLWVNTGTDFVDYVLINNGETDGRTSETASWGDYDNDGDLDLFIGNAGDTPDVPEKNILFRNDGLDANGNPIMTRMDSATVGDIVADVDLTICSAWADFDNDGDLDLFVGNDGGYAAGYRSRLYVNNGDGTFTKKTNTILVDSASFARSAAWSDFDMDGDMDIVVGRDGPNRLFVNNGNSNSFVEIKLIGVNANKSAIGTIVRIKATINGTPVWQMRDVNSQTGHGSHNSYRLHFGLGDAFEIDSLVIEWAGSGSVDIYEGLAANDFYEFTEIGTSAIDDDLTAIADQFTVLPNYPNPFNPETRLRFVLKKSSKVTIELYNISGEKLATIYRGIRRAGLNQVTFNGAQFASGMYLVKYRTENAVKFQKILLVK